jgi:Ca2+-binding RTX toxin-like protein
VAREGDDDLQGGNGNDRLFGGAGSDRYSGGAGRSIGNFVFGP